MKQQSQPAQRRRVRDPTEQEQMIPRNQMALAIIACTHES